MPQQRQRGAVGPMRVVDDEQHRCTLGQSGQESHHVIEDALLLGLRFQRRIGWHVGIAAAQRWCDGHEIGDERRCQT